MKKWNIQYKIQKAKGKRQNYSSKFKNEELIKILLENRGIKTKKEKEEFLNPSLKNVTVKSVGIDTKQLKKAVLRIKRAIKNQEQIVVFGDYDVDGICGTAILWESLNSLGAKVLPYIPHRIDEGYGLSIKGVQNVILNLFQNHQQFQHDEQRFLAKARNDKKKLIITVDNGIVAHEAVEFARKNNIDVIITDHHVRAKKDPKAYAIVHTTKLCGTGVAWMLSNVILSVAKNLKKRDPSVARLPQDDNRLKNDHLGLIALATVADLVPLTGANRVVTKFGIEVLHNTKRIGLMSLFKEAGIEQENIGVYEIGHIIAPRLNAMGRLEFAMESLRLLCTSNIDRAKLLAEKLGSTNRERQLLTQQSAEHALLSVRNRSEIGKLIFITHESYQQGVIGLVAGKLVEEFYRPSIVVSIGEIHSKASARSVSGFNIIEFIRSASEFLIDAGGHPMAAGFTIETAKLSLLQKALEERVQLLLSDELLVRSLRIDCELPLTFVTKELYDKVQILAPFGMGNPEPTFVSRDVEIEDIRVIGRDRRHLKLHFSCHPDSEQSEEEESSKSSRRDSSPFDALRAQNDKVKIFDAIAFGMADLAREFKIGDKVDIAYVIDENVWNGNTKLQLKIKDFCHARSLH